MYDKVLKKDGYRVLVDRLWPRGLHREEVAAALWAKELAPSPALRKWFGHEPERWPGFQKKYLEELRGNGQVESFLEACRGKKTITLLFSGKDTRHTHAIVLQHYLQQRLEQDADR